MMSDTIIQRYGYRRATDKKRTTPENEEPNLFDRLAEDGDAAEPGPTEPTEQSESAIPAPTGDPTYYEEMLRQAEAQEQAEQPMSDTTDEYAEQGADEYAEQPAEGYAEQGADEYAEQPAEGYAEQGADEYAEQPAEGYAEQGADEYAEQPAEGYAEQGAEYYVDAGLGPENQYYGEGSHVYPAGVGERRASGEQAEHMVEIRDLHMVFAAGLKPPVHALRGLNLTVERGSVMGLLGPNGCGKTTTLSCLLGLLNPQQGVMSIDGRKVRYGGFDATERPYGVVLEDTRLPPFLAVDESLRLVSKLRHLEGMDAHMELERVTSECEIGSVLNRRIAELSKGQARRVGLAAAMIGNPPLLVLDEPSSGLDVAARVEFDEILRRLHDGKRTVIIASHFLGDVQNTCTHVAVMQDGAVIVAGPTETLLDLTQHTTDEDGYRSNIYVEQKYIPVLAKAGIACSPCQYAGLVHVLTDWADDEFLPRLLEVGVVPRRMEPRVNLVSVYMNLIREAEGEDPIEGLSEEHAR